MVRTLVAVLSALFLLSALVVARQQNPIPDTYTNLQVLPKTITRAALVPVMRSFALSLGVRCEHCHVGEGNDLSKFDFAADAKPAKVTARRMMRMLERIHEDLQGVGDGARMPKVTCYTCHRGQRVPATEVPKGGDAGVPVSRREQ
jgi:hypothetical protein